MNNTQNHLSLTILYKASKSGFNVKVDTNILNDLELNKTAKDVLNEKNVNDQYVITTLEELEKYYGRYLIIGAIYGGNLLYKTTYSSNSSNHKMYVICNLQNYVYIIYVM